MIKPEHRFLVNLHTNVWCLFGFGLKTHIQITTSEKHVIIREVPFYREVPLMQVLPQWLGKLQCNITDRII